MRKKRSWKKENDYWERLIALMEHPEEEIGKELFEYLLKNNIAIITLGHLNFEDNILNIYFVRSDVAVSLNSMGEIENVLEIQDTMENTTYWNTIVAANKKYVGKDEYIVQNDMGYLGWFATSYSQLIKVDAHGRTRLIYDVNSYQLLHSIIVFVGVCAWIGYVIWKLFGEFKKLQENKEEP